MKRLGFVAVACLMSTVLLAGCEKEATGQVAAVVNGEEITLQEVNAELGQMQVPEGADKKQVQQAALQRIVDRRLLAQAAREDGLDKSPDFLIRRRQMEDALLVQLLGERTGRTTAVPDQAAVDAYVSDNPAVFGKRTIYKVDRIQFPVPSNLESLKSLENEHSMDAVAKRLDEMGIQFTRGEAAMDSGSARPGAAGSHPVAARRRALRDPRRRHGDGSRDHRRDAATPSRRSGPPDRCAADAQSIAVGCHAQTPGGRKGRRRDQVPGGIFCCGRRSDTGSEDWHIANPCGGAGGKRIESGCARRTYASHRSTARTRYSLENHLRLARVPSL